MKSRNESGQIYLSEEQVRIVATAVSEITNGARESMIGGEAGTGKTSMLDHAYEVLSKQVSPPNKIFIACPTHRACFVLKSKLGKGRPMPATIDSIVGHVKGDSAEQDNALAELYARLADAQKRGDVYDQDLIQKAIKDCQAEFNGTASEKVNINSGDYILCDESSMVKSKLREMALNRGAKIIWVGDPNQLPPVNEIGWFNPRPDMTLTQVFRQSEGSGVLEFARIINRHFDWRNVNALAGYAHGLEGVQVIVNAKYDTIDWKDLAGYNKVIQYHSYDYAPSGKPYSEWSGKMINLKLRREMGINDYQPMAGETLVATRRFCNVGRGVNLMTDDEIALTSSAYRMFPIGESVDPIFSDGEKWLENRSGVAGKVAGVENAYERMRLVGGFMIDAQLWDGRQVEGIAISPTILDSVPTNTSLMVSQGARPDHIFFSAHYGKAVTCHKAQGGEWDHVAVLVSRRHITRNDVSDFDKKSWLYTAATRAAKSLKLIVV